MKKIKKIIVIILFLIIGFILGYKYSEFSYIDKCLDLGGGKNPGNYDICVIEKYIDNGKMIPVESDNGIGDGAESLDELLKQNENN